MPKKTIAVDFTKVYKGINLTPDPAGLTDGEVQGGTYNARLLPEGVKRCPGAWGLSASNNFSTYLKMLEIYRQSNETERLLSLSGGILYEVNKTTEALTSLYTLTGTGEGVFRNFRGVGFTSNGTAIVKTETGGTTYQAGIDAPTGASAAAQSGGSLPAGTYGVYVGYARKVSGSNVLYSIAQSLGNVVLTGPGLNATVRVTCPNSSDSQVNNKVVWMTDENGSTQYFYWETGDNTTTTIDVTDKTTHRNSALVYSVEAADNYTPGSLGSPDYIEIHNGYLWVLIGNVLYYSRQAGTVYDLERFPASNYITLPHEGNGLFTVGDDLFINTVYGLLRLPYGVPTNAVEKVTEPFYWLYMGTVDRFKTGVIGLTNKGVMYFDGVNFSGNLSTKIMTEINKMFSFISLGVASTDHFPRGKVYRSDIRNEYHLCFMESSESLLSSGSLYNNRRWILDLDLIFSFDNALEHWELTEPAAEYMAVDSTGVMYNGQSVNGVSHIYKFKTNKTTNKHVYSGYSGITPTFLTSETLKTIKVVYRRQVPDIRGMAFFYQARLLTRCNSAITMTIVIDDVLDTSTSAAQQSQETLQPSDNPALWDEALFDKAYFSAENLVIQKKPLSCKMKGCTCHIEIEQSANDIDFLIMTNIIMASLKYGNLN